MLVSIFSLIYLILCRCTTSRYDDIFLTPDRMFYYVSLKVFCDYPSLFRFMFSYNFLTISSIFFPLLSFIFTVNIFLHAFSILFVITLTNRCPSLTSTPIFLSSLRDISPPYSEQMEKHVKIETLSTITNCISCFLFLLVVPISFLDITFYLSFFTWFGIKFTHCIGVTSRPPPPHSWSDFLKNYIINLRFRSPCLRSIVRRKSSSVPNR